MNQAGYKFKLTVQYRTETNGDIQVKEFFGDSEAWLATQFDQFKANIPYLFRQNVPDLSIYKESTLKGLYSYKVDKEPCLAVMNAAEYALNYSESWINSNKKFYAKRDSLAKIIDEKTRVGDLLEQSQQVVDYLSSRFCRADHQTAIPPCYDRLRAIIREMTVDLKKGE